MFEVLGLKLKTSCMASKCSPQSSTLSLRWGCCSCLGLACSPPPAEQGLRYPPLASNHHRTEGDHVLWILLPLSAGVPGAHLHRWLRGSRSAPPRVAQPLIEIGSHTVAQTGIELEVIFYLSFQSTEITGKCPCPQSACGREGLGQAGV